MLRLSLRKRDLLISRVYLVHVARAMVSSQFHRKETGDTIYMILRTEEQILHRCGVTVDEIPVSVEDKSDVFSI